ncbi:hypothetical protein [Vacuolonema iberomarrocanum]|uniref:hypothetical protein n=1 Tax=Vacuolonema iberomarrocanum TaxID=3454632 RepID=UPI0019FCA2EF|nr:hypothetical protein [filamentous cyanobacterium LEGE 07170]
MKSLLYWIFGSILGGGIAAVTTIFITGFLLYFNVYNFADSLYDPNATPGFLAPLLTFLWGTLVGCLHGGLIGGVQGLLILRKIPQNKQALYTACKGSFVNLALFGILFNLVVFAPANIQIFAFLSDGTIRTGLFLIFLSATVSGLVQGLVQYRTLKRRNSELFPWCFYSIVSGNLALFLLLFKLWFFIRFLFN